MPDIKMSLAKVAKAYNLTMQEAESVGLWIYGQLWGSIASLMPVWWDPLYNKIEENKIESTDL